jgi:hypothetical protein
MAKLLEALAFAARGVDVFPMDLGSKRPSISFIEQATRDPERIKLLWRDPITGSKDYNIGVLCGNTLIIVDIDTKYDKKFGRSALANYESIGGHFDTLVIKTASGGYQAYFRLPVGKTFTNAQDVVPGIDIRCEHGYGIGPGSFSIESGGGYEIYVDKPIAELPEMFIPLLKPIKTRKERFNGHADSEKAIPLYIEYLEHVAPAIEGQGGDQHTYNVACMGVRDYGLSEPTTTSLMLQHFNARCEPPWSADELQKKVENAEAYAIGQTGSRDPEVILNGVTYMPVAAAPVTLLKDDSLMIPQAGQTTPTKWLVKSLLVQREMTMLVGPGGVGKSMLLIALSIHAATGRDFGAFKIAEPFDVLLYNSEDNSHWNAGRTHSACQLYNIDFQHVRQHFMVMSQDYGKHFTLVEYSDRKMQIPPDTIRFFSEYRNKHPNCKLIAMDPLRKILRGINENDNAQMSEAMLHLHIFAQELDVSLIVTHHTAKNVMQRKDLDPNSPDLSVGAGSVVSRSRLVANMLPQMDYDRIEQGRHNEYFSLRISKSNHGPMTDPSWFARRIVHHVNGDQYPVAMPIDVANAAVLVNTTYVATIGDYMIQYNKNKISVPQAALVIQDAYEPDRSARSLQEQIRLIFKRGTVPYPYTDITTGQRYSMQLDVEGKSQMLVLIDGIDGSKLPAPALILPEYQEPEADTPAPPLA